MYSIPLSLMAWPPDANWVIPVISGVAFSTAFLVGWRFLLARPSPIDLEPTGEVDARFLQGLTRERRATPRRSGNAVEVDLVDDSNGTPLIAWVQDRSIGGICILAPVSIPEGAVLRVRPRKAVSSTPWTSVTVRSCRRNANQFDLGCQFHHTPNWNVMLMFG